MDLRDLGHQITKAPNHQLPSRAELHAEAVACLISVQTRRDNPPVPEPPVDYQKLLLQHLELIDGVVKFVARRHRLSAADAEEFSSLVRFKLIDHDFAILRKFLGRSHIRTYLITVVEHLYLDDCIARWGRWRPSAVALRLGPTAVLLERLVARDGLTFDEAVGTLQTNHGLTESREQLHDLLLQLPLRLARRPAADEELALVVAGGLSADSHVDLEDDQQLVARVEETLGRALAALPDRDRLILKLRFLDDVPVARIARLFGEDGRGLYKHVERMVAALRAGLEQDGIGRAEIERVIGHPALSLGRMLGDEPDEMENGGTRPSKG